MTMKAWVGLWLVVVFVLGFLACLWVGVRAIDREGRAAAKDYRHAGTQDGGHNP